MKIRTLFIPAVLKSHHAGLRLNDIHRRARRLADKGARYINKENGFQHVGVAKASLVQVGDRS